MKEFDFTQAGKKMPYTVPDGFFDEAKRQALETAARTRQQRRPVFASVTVRRIAVAASIAAIAAGAWFGLRPAEESTDSLMARYEQLLATIDIEEAEDLAMFYDDWQDIFEYDEEFFMSDEF